MFGREMESEHAAALLFLFFPFPLGDCLCVQWLLWVQFLMVLSLSMFYFGPLG